MYKALSYPSRGIFFIFMLMVLSIAGCTKKAVTSETDNDHAVNIFSSYYEDCLKRHPLSATYRGDHRFDDQLGDRIDYNSRMYFLESTESYLEQLKTLDYSKLSHENQLSFDLLFYRCQMDIEALNDGYFENTDMLPINLLLGMPSKLAELGSGESRQPFKTVKDYENWLERAGQFPRWAKHAIDNMNQGIKKQIVYPTVIVDKILDQLKPFTLKNIDNSIFYRPILNMPDSISSADKKRFALEYHKLIEDQLTPTYQRLYDYLLNTYRKHASNSVGINALPNGSNWYRYLVRQQTTTDMTPEAIHLLGINHVKKLFIELQEIKNALKFDGSMAAFFQQLKKDKQFTYTSEAALLDSYKQLKSIVDPRLKEQFNQLPKTPYIIKPVPQFLAKDMPPALYLEPTEDGRQPGVFYVNTFDLASRSTYVRDILFLHEAVPGHHLQRALTLEQANMSNFRKYYNCNAYSEGWALYAESLGKPLGIYTDIYQEVGAITYALVRAVRLVVDTGIHYYGWDKQKAANWMKNYTPLTTHEIETEIDRYIAMPAQALSYMIGSLTIHDLKAQAKATLDTAFDVREFHDEILNDGPLTMHLLRKKIQTWIKQKAQSVNPDYPQTAKQTSSNSPTTNQ